MGNAAKFFLFSCLLALSSLAAWGKEGAHSVKGMRSADDVPMSKMEVTRLPDLKVSRGGHSTLCVGGEVVVFGGHTSGFMPTPTAEYLHDGEWHLIDMVYAHDHGFSLLTRSGRALLGGGHEKPLGIGQVHHVEWYDPVSHTFDGFGCLDTKRVFPSAEQLSGGDVVISGNWYYQDNTEIFELPKRFAVVRDVLHARSFPYVFPMPDDDAVILGRVDTVGNLYDFTPVVERLRREPFEEPLLAEWQPFSMLIEHHASDCCIGDTAHGDYAYLMGVENREGQVAIVLIRDTVFSLLPTVCPIPMEGPKGRINYFYTLADRKAARGYLLGNDADRRFFVLAVDLSHIGSSAAPLTLYYTDPLENIGWSTPVLTDKGDLVLAGGVFEDNFTPKSGAYVLRLGNRLTESVGGSWLRTHGWLWVVLLIFVVLSVGVGLQYHLRRLRTDVTKDVADASMRPQNEDAAGDLMERICQLMENRQLYLHPDLRVSDIAESLGVPRRAVSECLSAQSPAISFPQFVNAYRISYAQQLFRHHPDKKVAAVGEESGFANETSFFRTFKAIVGVTPKEWVQQELLTRSDADDMESSQSL